MKLRLNPRKRSLVFAGQEFLLQHKTFQVLSRLMTQAPQSVSREDLINDVWQGNHWTGEKGLTQAIWHLRQLLGDDHKNPTFIETLPRVGYRWLRGNPVATRMPWRLAASVAAVGTVLLMGLITLKSPLPKALSAVIDQNNRVRVDFPGGCHRFIQASGIMKLSHPVLSKDGYSVAFSTTDQNGSCSLVTVDVHSGRYEQFSQCPVT